MTFRNRWADRLHQPLHLLWYAPFITGITLLIPDFRFYSDKDIFVTQSDSMDFGGDTYSILPLVLGQKCGPQVIQESELLITFLGSSVVPE